VGRGSTAAFGVPSDGRGTGGRRSILIQLRGVFVVGLLMIGRAILNRLIGRLIDKLG
jgi:hypothetical protein